MRRLPESELREAIEIQQRCYQTLRWVDGQVRSGELRFFTDHGPLDEVAAASAWFRENWHGMPAHARPHSIDDDVLEKYANYFTSFLLASFDAVPEHGDVTQPGICGCACPLCARLSKASHFQPRFVGTRAKSQAASLSIRALAALANEAGLSLPESSLAALLRDESLRADAALVAYALDLLDRVNGASGDEVSLALWRRFAYTRAGAPVRGFSLSFELVREAEQSFVAVLRRAAS